MQKRLLILFVILAALAAGVATFYYYWSSIYNRSAQTGPITTEQPVADTEPELVTPKRTEYSGAKPDGFPAGIPIEEGVTFDQSYSLDYSGRKQLSIIFASKKTLTEKYDFYVDFFEKNGWATMNNHQSDMIGAIYGVKEGGEINVVISPTVDSGQASSQVSITALQSL